MTSKGYRKVVRWGGFLAACGLGLFPCSPVAAQGKREVRVAAAADLQPVMPAFAAAFEKETGVHLIATFGSSAMLATQIKNGSPVDVFLGADYSFPEQVVAAGKAIEAAPEAYAKGTLVLWARKDAGLGTLSLATLKDPVVKKIAVADEFHAPYGRAAYAALRWVKLLDEVKAKLVVAENVGQAGQFVESGNAQVGFLSMTLANSQHFKALGDYTRVPSGTYAEIRQCGVVIKGSAHEAEGKAFLAWIRSPGVQEHMASFGLERVQ